MSILILQCTLSVLVSTFGIVLSSIWLRNKRKELYGNLIGWTGLIVSIVSVINILILGALLSGKIKL